MIKERSDLLRDIRQIDRESVPVASDGAHDWSAAFFVQGIDISTCLKSKSDGFIIAAQSSTVEVMMICDELSRRGHTRRRYGKEGGLDVGMGSKR